MLDDAVAVLKKELGLGSDFDRRTRALLLNALGRVRFREAIVKYIREDRKDTWDAVGLRLGVDRGTIWKYKAWEEGRLGGNPPDFLHLMAYLSLVHAEPDLVFPDGWVSFCDGVREALLGVADELKVKRPDAHGRIRRVENELADSWPVLIDTLLRLRFSELRDESGWVEMLDRARRRARPGAKVTTKRLRAWVEAWFLPWCLLWDASGVDMPQPPDAAPASRPH